MIKIGQIGCGYWGPNLLRNLYNHQQTEVKYVAETDPERQAYVKSRYRDIRVVDDHSVILADGTIDAVIIATPAGLHYRHTKEALLAGKHCFVEKPLAMRTVEARELISIAETNHLKLMIGHVFLYNSAVRKLKEEITKGTLGDVYYIYSQRLNLGRIREDVNALWNFAPHDVSIFLYLIESQPLWVSAVGACYVQPAVEDVVFLTLGFQNGVVANTHISWLDPSKVRKMTVVGTKQMIVYDDVADYKIQIYDKGIEKIQLDHSLESYDSFGKFQLIHRAGDLLIPKIDFKEPLTTEIAHFIETIIEDKKPLTDGLHGMEVTRILEAGTASMQNNGARIDLN
jgi:predicted dehydrogenase